MIPENGIKNHSLWKKRRKKKFNKAFILLIVLVYIVSRTTPILTENANHFHTITHGTLEETLSFEGVILRNEQVLTNNSQGMLVESGERVGHGQEITNSLKSPSPGIVTGSRDGFEESLRFEGVVHNSDPYLDTIQKLLDHEDIDTQDGIRLITGYDWGAVGAISSGKAAEIQSGQRVWVEARGQRVRGKIVWIQDRENIDTSLILVESSEYLEGIYDHRKLSFTLVKRKVEGLSVPIDAVYYQEEQAYVTQRQTGNNVKVPVNIILADEQMAILSADQFTDSKGDVWQTVSLYDEILLKQGNSNGKEGLYE